MVVVNGERWLLDFVFIFKFSGTFFLSSNVIFLRAKIIALWLRIMSPVNNKLNLREQRKIGLLEPDKFVLCILCFCIFSFN